MEWFNRTLNNMLVKTAEKHGTDWDEHLPYVLFAYRTSLQESIQESPFFLLHGRDARLPLEDVLMASPARQVMHLDNYTSELAVGMAEA